MHRVLTPPHLSAPVCQVTAQAGPGGAPSDATGATLEQRTHDVYRSVHTPVDSGFEAEGSSGGQACHAGREKGGVEKVGNGGTSSDKGGTEACSTMSKADTTRGERRESTDEPREDGSGSGSDVIKSVDVLRQICLLLHGMLEVCFCLRGASAVAV